MSSSTGFYAGMITSPGLYIAQSRLVKTPTMNDIEALFLLLKSSKKNSNVLK